MMPHSQPRSRRLLTAKLTPPHLPNVVTRGRLVKQLDRARARPVTWIMGPAGIGKTTLVASYAARRKLPCLWYQLDEGDGDVAGLFHYLSLAMQRIAPRHRKPLPHFTAEYRRSLNAFTRRFFESLYARLKTPFLLVFDNYHHVPMDSQLHEMLEVAWEQMPAGITAIVMSRDLPPPSLARLQALQSVQVFDPDALRLTPEEAGKLVRLYARGKRRRLTQEFIARMHDKTDGWVAGLVLLLDNAVLNDDPDDCSGTETPEVLFEFLAREVLQDMADEIQTFLLKTSFLPLMTATMAEQLTGLHTAGRVLGQLYQTRHFTERRSGPEPVYQYHALFRDFLMAQARQRLDAAELRTVQQAAAELLEGAGHIDAAVVLLETAGRTDELLRIALAHAPSLMAEGRAQTLEGWLRKIPVPHLASVPWGLFWLGTCTCLTNHDEGQRLLERAFKGFQQNGDRAGMLSASCGIVESIMATWVNMPTLGDWVEQLRVLVENGAGFPSDDIEARVAFVFFMAQEWHRPEKAAMRPLADRVESMLRRNIDPVQAMLLGFYLVVYHSWMADYEAMERVLTTLERVGKQKTLSPLAQIWLRAAKSAHAFSTADADACLTDVEQGLNMAREYGLEPMASVLWMNGALGAVAAGDLATAEQYLAATRSMPDQIGLYHHISGWVAALRGDPYEAWRHVEHALTFAVNIGAIFPEALNRLPAAQLLHEQGQHTGALQHLARARQIGELTGSEELLCRCELLEAQFAFDRGDMQGGLQALRRAMMRARARGLVNWIWWRPSVMAHLCAQALEAGIEVQYVKHLIHTRKLMPDPPPTERSAWPWTVAVHTLGRFELFVDGEAVAFPHKAQQRPLEMLKAVIAMGGQDVSEASLIDALWPDAEGDAGHQTFAVTLHRLRKLTGQEHIELKGGRVSLCRQSCFVDVWAFERLLDQAEAAVRTDDRESGTRFREKALSLYAGDFLVGDPAPWGECLRTRLRQKFVRAVLQHGKELEGANQYERAVEWLEKGLVSDPAAQDLRSALDLTRHRLTGADSLAG